MKRDFAKRGTRMVHKFGELETRSDPLQVNTFQPPVPNFPKQRSTGGFDVRGDGEYSYRPETSPVVKPNGEAATLCGKAPDRAAEFAFAIPAGTKKRKVK